MLKQFSLLAALVAILAFGSPALAQPSTPTSGGATDAGAVSQPETPTTDTPAAEPKDETYQKMLDSTVPANEEGKNIEVKNEPESTPCAVCWEKGPFTKEHPTASRVLLFPVRLVTAVVGAPVGAITGMSKGADYATARATHATWSKIHDHKVPGTKTAKTFQYGPAGLVSNLVALPVGATVGFVRGAGIGVAKGFMYPDKL